MIVMSFQRACEVMPIQSGEVIEQIYLKHTNEGHSSEQTCLLALIKQTRQHTSASKRRNPQNTVPTELAMQRLRPVL